MSEYWRLLETGVSSGVFNMQVDSMLLEAVAVGQSAPALRFYKWAPPAISLGRNQSPERELDLEKVNAAKLDVVTRVTGGRAVLHWNELTYSIIVPEGDSVLGESREVTYREIAKALICGLQLFGITADLNRKSTLSPQLSAEKPVRSKPPCFASTAKWEITYRDRKLVGSAQRRIRGAILQHGSLLIGPEHRFLNELLNPPRKSVVHSDICLQEIVGGPIDPLDLLACIRRGFREYMQMELIEDILAPIEKAEIDSRCCYVSKRVA
tara:strand:+ start:4789 stop:5589 length:801 start_codon:yes stop_codon:yes gene_type:complete